MVVTNGVSDQRGAPRRRKTGIQAPSPVPAVDRDQGAVKKEFSNPVIPQGQMRRESVFDPRKRGGEGLAGPAGTPTALNAGTLSEATSIINAEAENNFNSANAVPTVGVMPEPIIDAPETVSAESIASRTEKIKNDAEAKRSALGDETARLTKGADLALIDAEEKSAMDVIDGELEAEKQVLLDEQTDLFMEQDPGLSFYIANERAKKALALKTKLPEQADKVEDLTNKFSDPQYREQYQGIELQKAFSELNNLEDAKDFAVDVLGLPMSEANAQVKELRQSMNPHLDAAQFEEIDSFENNSDMFNKALETPDSDKRGAVMLSAIKNISKDDPSGIMEAGLYMQVLTSDTASPVQKALAQSNLDLIAQTKLNDSNKNFLTAEQFKAGLGTEQQKLDREEGTRRFNALNKETQGGIIEVLAKRGVDYEEFLASEDEQQLTIDTLARGLYTKSDAGSMRKALVDAGKGQEASWAVRSGGLVENKIQDNFNVSGNIFTSEFKTAMDITRKAGYGNQKFHKDYNESPDDFATLSNKTRNLDRANELFEKLKNSDSFNAIAKKTTDIGQFLEKVKLADPEDLNQDLIELTAIIDNELVQFMQQTSGAAISEQEVNRLKTIFANTGNSPSQFKENFGRFLKDFVTQKAAALNSRGIGSSEQLDEIIDGKTKTVDELLDELRGEGQFGFDSNVTMTSDPNAEPAKEIVITPELYESFNQMTDEQLSGLTTEELDRLGAYEAPIEGGNDQFLRDQEGFRSDAYIDSAGIPTIGFGFTSIDGVPVKMGDTMTQEEADIEFPKQKAAHSNYKDKVKVNLTPDQETVLASFEYNLGPNIWDQDGKELMGFINAGEFDKAADALLKFNKVKEVIDGKWTGKYVVVEGLNNRRKREADLLRSTSNSVI